MKFIPFTILLVTALFLETDRLGWAASATAEIRSIDSGSTVEGRVLFKETPLGMEIHAEFKQAPEGDHGFHIHEYGVCADQGKAAGDHFNPDGVTHGYLPENGFQQAHAGDFGNIQIEANGTGKKEIVIKHLTFHDGPYAIAGRSVILHAGRDQFTQPAGDAGGRIGCGPIVMSAEDKIFT